MYFRAKIVGFDGRAAEDDVAIFEEQVELASRPGGLGIVRLVALVHVLGPILVLVEGHRTHFRSEFIGIALREYRGKRAEKELVFGGEGGLWALFTPM